MNRKRLISILAATALSVAGFAGPAAAVEDADLNVQEDSVEAELGDTSVSVEADEDPAAEAETSKGSVTLDTDDEQEPVKASSKEDDGSSDPVEELGNEVDKALGNEDEPKKSPAPGDNNPEDDNDVHTAGGDTTVAPRPALSAFDNAPRKASLGSQTFRHFSYTSYQRPAPSATTTQPEVTETGELAPVVAPPREQAVGTAPVELAAATPIGDSQSTPAGLRLLATLMVAGAALSWWNAREAAEAQN